MKIVSPVLSLRLLRPANNFTIMIIACVRPSRGGEREKLRRDLIIKNHLPWLWEPWLVKINGRRAIDADGHVEWMGEWAYHWAVDHWQEEKIIRATHQAWDDGWGSAKRSARWLITAQSLGFKAIGMAYRTWQFRPSEQFRNATFTLFSCLSPLAFYDNVHAQHPLSFMLKYDCVCVCLCAYIERDRHKHNDR